MRTECCFNTLQIEGDAKNLKKFVQQAKNDKQALSLASLYPMPSDVSPHEVHLWFRNHWGTVNDIEDVKLDDTFDERLTYHFVTDWTPPVAWLRKVAKDFPQLKFILKYDDEDSLIGCAVGKDDMVTDTAVQY